MAELTQEPWFVALHRHNARGAVIHPNERMTRELLEKAGCADDAECTGFGTAGVRIPVEWAKKVEKDGHYSTTVSAGSNTWQLEIDLP